MIGWWEAVTLGIIQGITEYLPVSSSGHLVLGQALLGMEEPALLFDIVLHLGTLVAVFWYYFADISAVVKETCNGCIEILGGKNWRDTINNRPAFRLGLLIIGGTFPTAIIGLTFRDEFKVLFGSPLIVGFMLLLTGVILFLTKFTSDSGREELRLRDALIIGAIQGLAIIPGISRSGSTICAALFLGVGREAAARFSFLISIPAILGALILHLETIPANLDLVSMAIGFVASTLVGALCLTLLVTLIKKGRLSWFSYYCFAIGLLTIATFV